MTLNIPFDFTHCIVNSVPRSEGITGSRRNCLPLGGMPTLDISSYDNYIVTYVRSIDAISPFPNMHDINKLLNKLENVVKDGIQTLYCIVTNRYGKKIIVEFRLDVDITYGSMIYLYTLAYQKAYATKDKFKARTSCQSIPLDSDELVSDNRAIEELVYSGKSIVTIYKNYIACEFICELYSL